MVDKHSPGEKDARMLASWLSSGHLSDPRSKYTEEDAAELWQLYRQLFPEGSNISCSDFGLLKARCVALCSLLCVPLSIAEAGCVPFLHRECFEIIQELKTCVLQLSPKDCAVHLFERFD